MRIKLGTEKTRESPVCPHTSKGSRGSQIFNVSEAPVYCTVKAIVVVCVIEPEVPLTVIV
jgi:hypothetical protein